jgi:hypothetical protein
MFGECIGEDALIESNSRIDERRQSLPSSLCLEDAHINSQGFGTNSGTYLLALGKSRRSR